MPLGQAPPPLSTRVVFLSNAGKATGPMHPATPFGVRACEPRSFLAPLLRPNYLIPGASMPSVSTVFNGHESRSEGCCFVTDRAGQGAPNLGSAARPLSAGSTKFSGVFVIDSGSHLPTTRVRSNSAASITGMRLPFSEVLP